MQIVRHDDRASWLAWRREAGNKYYGASEASVCANINPWKSPRELYLEKVGLKEVEDISEKERVIYGTEAEEPIRRLFELDFSGKIDLKHEPFDYYLDAGYPYIGATLDGIVEWIGEDKWEVTSPTGYDGVIEKGMVGIYEGKTALVRNREDFEMWQSRCPDWYFAQGCQQLYVMRKEAKFWIVNTLVEKPNFRKDFNDEFIEIMPTQQIIRHVYFMDDPVVKSSIEFVISKVVEMYWRVENKAEPEAVIGG